MHFRLKTLCYTNTKHWRQSVYEKKRRRAKCAFFAFETNYEENVKSLSSTLNAIVDLLKVKHNYLYCNNISKLLIIFFLSFSENRLWQPKSRIIPGKVYTHSLKIRLSLRVPWNIPPKKKPQQRVHFSSSSSSVVVRVFNTIKTK